MRTVKLLIIIINLLYVTPNKLKETTVADGMLDQLLRYLSIDGFDNESRCQFDVSRSNKKQPLLVDPNTSKFLHPMERSGAVTLRHNDEIELFCSTGFSHPPSAIAGNSVRISCRSGHFRSKHTNIKADSFSSVDDFQCHRPPFHTARRRPKNERCFNNATLVDVGFEIGKKFISVLTLCHDEAIQTTYYARYTLTPANVAAQRGVKRPSFIQADFFDGKDVNSLYRREHQRSIIEAIADFEDEYEDDDAVYLSRGHLAAKGDFIYGNEQRATFYYINAVPQWQSFNGQNWRAIEDGSRRLAAARNTTLIVYTGTHGVLSMRNSRGRQHDVYLDMVNKQVPVPKLLYKMLIDAGDSDSGVVFVCANNVYASASEIRRDYVICEDVSDEIGYVKWRPREIRRGFCYACRVDEFLAKVPHVDGAGAANLLT